MHSNQSDRKAPARGFSAAIRYGLIALVSVVGAGFGASACLVRPLCDQDCRPRTTNIFVDTITQKTVDKIDLLFMIDNSLSMADKQQVLKAAVPDLVRRLVSPNCVDPTTTQLVPGTPDAPDAPCPGTSVREFKAITDIHIGVITSSLGGHGSTDTCVGNDNGTLSQQEQDDHGHLIASRPRWAGESAKNYANAPFQQPEPPAGYLNWNPKTPGHGDINQFNTTFQMMVTASSEFGCGLESQLEAIYRFLSDPNPPQSIVLQACQAGTTQMCAFPSGKDTTLLAQRAAFLRPDSLVAVMFVTDENDCSIKDERQFFFAASQKVTLPQGSAVCATNPNDPCCYSCGSGPPGSCPPDPTCKSQPANWLKLDQTNLRCFEEKRRFGLDFLYPTARYVNALKQTQICTSRDDLDASNTADSPCPDADHNNLPDIVPNPLYSDLTGGGALPRAPNLVFLAGIVGVPWQDIQATTNNALMPPGPYPANELHYQTAKDLLANKVWDAILGNSNPGSNVPPIPPTDNLMVESRQPRGGNDGTGKPLAGPQVPPSQNNAINGHEWADTGNDDLMYACIFPLQTPRDCTQVEADGKANPPTPGCDCGALTTPEDFNPLCEDMTSGVYGHTQFRAKGYPGLRELQVLKDYGENSIVASICARNLDPAAQATAQDWGYRPAVDAIVDRLKEALTGRCLPRKLAPDPQTNKIPCSIIEVRAPGSDPSCPAANGRAPVTTQLEGPALQTMRDKGICGDPPLSPCTTFPLCQILEAGQPCHMKEGTPQPVPGWCYVDPLSNPQDDPSLVSKCPASEQRIIRFVGDQTPAQGAQVLIACFGAQLDQATTPTGAAGAGAVGAGGAADVGAGGAAVVGAGGAAAAAGGAAAVGAGGGP